MSDIENVQPNSSIAAKEKPPARKMLTKTEKRQDVLLVLSVAQLVLGLTLYMLAAISFWCILLFTGIVVAMAVLSYFKFNQRAPRIALRALCIFLGTVPFVIWLVFNILVYREASAYSDPVAMQQFYSWLWLTFAIAVMSPPLFLQPVFVVNAGSRRRFDMMMLRIVSIVTCVDAVILCTLALEYKINNDQLLNTAATYSPVIFGEQINLTVATDNILTRVLFCALSAAIITLSFRIHSRGERESEENTL